jgi:hypothetical protein
MAKQSWQGVTCLCDFANTVSPDDFATACRLSDLISFAAAILNNFQQFFDGENFC